MTGVLFPALALYLNVFWRKTR